LLLATLAFLAFQETNAATAVAADAVATADLMPPGQHSPESTPDKISNEDRQTDSEGVPKPAIRNSLRDSRAGCAGSDDRPRRRIHRRRRETLGVVVRRKRSLRNPPSHLVD